MPFAELEGVAEAEAEVVYDAVEENVSVSCLMVLESAMLQVGWMFALLVGIGMKSACPRTNTMTGTRASACESGLSCVGVAVAEVGDLFLDGGGLVAADAV